jgi:hypothetical protein
MKTTMGKFVTRDRVYEGECIVPGNGGNQVFSIRPDVVFRLTDVTVTLHDNSPAKSEIEYIIIGNVIQAMFAKRTTTAYPSVAIRVHLVNFEQEQELVKVIIKGVELVE